MSSMRIFPGGLVGVFVVIGLFSTASYANVAQTEKTLIPIDVKHYSSIDKTIKKLAVSPKVTQPKWLKKQLEDEKKKAAAAAVRASADGSVQVLYTVQTRGRIASDLDEFKTLVQQTLDDTRGWRSLGITFKQVSSGGSFTLVLAQAEQVAAASSGCSAEWSCRVGSSVLINDDRWSGATTAWNNAGGSLRDYRHMVVNHEVGHWLGHDHEHCSGAGKLAPIMQQQSINLEGCKFNPWPLDNELSAPNLGL